MSASFSQWSTRWIRNIVSTSTGAARAAGLLEDDRYFHGAKHEALALSFRTIRSLEKGRDYLEFAFSRGRSHCSSPCPAPRKGSPWCLSQEEGFSVGGSLTVFRGCAPRTILLFPHRDFNGFGNKLYGVIGPT